MKAMLKAASHWLISAALTMSLLACHGDSEDSDNACLAGSGKGEVLEIMQDWYLWNDEADQFNKYRNIDLRGFSDTGALLDFLRYRPNEFDRGFSYITTPEEEVAFFDEGEFVGFGFSMARSGDEIIFSQVFDDSPADAAGFERGYRLLAINGRSIAQIEANEGLSAALGPAEVGYTATFVVQEVDGDVRSPVSLGKAVVTIDPVPIAAVIGDTGYILFNTFISSANNELRAAFADFGLNGISNIVIDLRYNGGGLVGVSEVLASLLAGPGNVGNIYTRYRFNSDRAPEFNESADFHEEANALTLDKIVFITSSGSASASELVINGLKPYFSSLDLALVGSATYGKPVGQFAFDFCNDSHRLRAVTFKSVNADGDGDYYDGLPVDCPAEDGLSFPLGDPNEASLAAALEYMGTGACPGSGSPGFGINRAGGAAKAQPILGPGLAQQYAGAF